MIFETAQDREDRDRLWGAWPRACGEVRIDMNDTELMSLAMLVQSETFERAWENKTRTEKGLALAYDESITWPAQGKLRDELTRRGLL